jgi:hypothetical protein
MSTYRCVKTDCTIRMTAFHPARRLGPPFCRGQKRGNPAHSPIARLTAGTGRLRTGNGEVRPQADGHRCKILDLRTALAHLRGCAFSGSPCRNSVGPLGTRSTATGRTDRSSSLLRRNADGTACSMSLRLTTCDNIRRTVIGGHMSLQGMPASDWGGSSQRCWLREGSGGDRRPNKGLRSAWTIWTEGSLVFLPQLWNIPVLGS